jgi:ATP-dependent helicase STH1/SNF2
VCFSNLRELWSLLNFLLPSMFDCAESFDEWFSRPFENQGLVAARNNNDADEAAAEALLDEEEKELIIRRLHSILRPFLLRREKKDVATELPAKTECVLQCALSPWQTRLYERIQSDSALVTVGADGVARIKQLHNTFMQLRKIAIHPYLFEETDMPCTAQMHRCSGKFVQLHRMLPKLVRSGHRVLLFSQMTRLLDILDDYLRWRGLKFVRLDGSSSTDERAEAQQLFNAPGSSIPLFILSTKAGGLGLNLQTADTVILIDSAWNPFEDRQAMDRAHRIGSKNEVRVIRLISRCPVEEQMLSRAQEKLRVDELIIQSGRFDQNSSAEERKSLLQTILRQRVRSSHEAPAPTDIEVNRLLARTEEEFEAFQRMDQALEAEDVAAWADEPGNKDKPWPGRLLTEAELPAHIKEAGLLEQLKAADALNDAALPWRRAAASFKLNPADSLTERQWMRCLERGSVAQHRHAAFV